ncbi:MAG: subtilisin-like proprotein convertase family protein [Myxococcota bacterium]|jgi:subtilisin-like proprotein convertase family protein
MIRAALILVVLAVPQLALAVPHLMSVQGALHSDAGPVEGTFGVAFTLYDAEDGGAVLYTESVEDVIVLGGAFEQILGLDVINPLVPSVFTDHVEVWLAVQVLSGPGVPVGGDVELPARPFTTAAFAFAAHHALTADTATTADSALTALTATTAATAEALDCVGCIQAAHLAPGLLDNAGGGGPVAEEDLPADGLDEVSNGVLSNEFEATFASSASVAIPDYFPPGASSTIIIPDIGIAETLLVSVEVNNSDMSTLSLTLTDPNGVVYSLWELQPGASPISATYPTPDSTLSGDLATWFGQNPAGAWTLKAVDNGFNTGGDDGAIASWSVSVHTQSNQKVALNGSMEATGPITAQAGVIIGSNPAACTQETQGAVHFDVVDKRLFLCDGSQLLQIMVCSPSCPSAADSACDVPVLSGCGTSCGSPGTGLNSTQCLSNVDATFCGVPVVDSCDNDCNLNGTALDVATCSAAEEVTCGDLNLDACGNQCPGGTGTLCAGEENCIAGSCAGVGLSPGQPGLSCLAIKTAVPSSADSLYWIDPDGVGGVASQQVFCDMTTDGGGFALALVQNVGVNWGCLTPGAGPTSPTAHSNTVLHHGFFSAMGATEMYVAESGGPRVLKFYFPRPGVPFLSNYRNVTERSCFNGTHYSNDAPHTGGDRDGDGHVSDACSTGSYPGWKAQNDCHRDSTNSHPSWGNSPGNGQSYNGSASCWPFGGGSMSTLNNFSTCLAVDQAPWADYSTDDLSGKIQLWIR